MNGDDMRPRGEHLDELDDRLADLIDERARATCRQHGLSEQHLDDEAKASILRHIDSACRGIIRPTHVSFLGPPFSYSHLAAIKYFGDVAAFDPVTSIAAVFKTVGRSAAREKAVADNDDVFGVVPIENNTDGRVVDTLSLLTRADVSIVGEVALPIHHYLLSKSPQNSIIEVHSKPQALSQCRTWLAEHLPKARLVESTSTAGAAGIAAQTPGVAAVASVEAGRAHGLDVIAERIEDNRDNVTRFAVLGNHTPEPSGEDKTSLLFQVAHQPGALADVMTTFKGAGLNLTWIESFPIPARTNEYFFFVEFDGHASQPAVDETLTKLREQTQQLSVLGSYRKANAGTDDVKTIATPS